MSPKQPSAAAARVPDRSRVRVEDVMHPGVIGCSPVTPLRDVAKLMADSSVHTVVVVGAGEDRLSSLWGLISSRDLVAAMFENDYECTAGQIAITEAVRVSTEDRLDRAVRLMVDHQVDHLIVVGAADGHPVGVLSTLDVAAILA